MAFRLTFSRFSITKTARHRLMPSSLSQSYHIPSLSNSFLSSSSSLQLSSQPLSQSTLSFDRRFSSLASAESSKSSKLSSSCELYTVAKICEKGSISIENFSLSEILEGSSMHIRDLFSLALTSIDEHDKFKSLIRERGMIDGALRRKKIRPPCAILPRRGEIIVSFGNIRALIGSESAMIFNAHEQSTQVTFYSFSLHIVIYVHCMPNSMTKMTLLSYYDLIIYHSILPDLSTESFSTLRLPSIITHYARKHFANSVAQSIQLKISEMNDINTVTHHSLKTYTPNDPFEVDFLEHILRDVCDSYNRRLTIYEPIVQSSLNSVTEEFLLSETGVHRLVPIKDSLQDFRMRVNSTLECLTHLLQNDEDMVGLLLAENLVAEEKGEVLEHTRHGQMELLLEEYARQLNNARHEVDYLLRRVQSKQEMVAISLDAYRNKMVKMSLTVSITSMGFATSTTVAGFYGMNLINGLEEHPTAFWSIVLATSTAGFLMVAGCMAYISAPVIKRRTLKRHQNIETINHALSNMGALDYTIKKMLENEAAMSKEEFGKLINSCENTTYIKQPEIDFLFDIFDETNDGFLYNDDFPTLEHIVPEKLAPRPAQSTLEGCHTK